MFAQMYNLAHSLQSAQKAQIEFTALHRSWPRMTNSSKLELISISFFCFACLFFIQYERRDGRKGASEKNSVCYQHSSLRNGMQYCSFGRSSSFAVCSFVRSAIVRYAASLMILVLYYCYNLQAIGCCALNQSN